MKPSRRREDLQCLCPQLSRDPDINIEFPNHMKKGWKWIKMMFTGKDRKALQTLIDNSSITSQIQQTPNLIANAIQTTSKEDKHFWHYHNGLISDLLQNPDKIIYPFNTCVIQLTNNCLFSNRETKETLKIFILQHAVK